ncbi:hypothetical protein [Thermomonospora umbrina]|uniref:Lipoprotein LprG n=1 Tax=Thermomonospora umbrina TaxID=111806 RepID=A0A3D9SMR0_9ACTN|nr:hypothetical protein [Thermomonospora umbrina]REE95700.1 hypothetical protein DFJ69_1109 [Thermomonospora umbrina]
MRAPTALALAAVLGLSLAACGSGDDTKEPGAGGPGNAGSGKPLALAELAGIIEKQLAAKKSFKAVVSAQGKEQGTLTVSTLAGTREVEVSSPKNEDGGPLHLIGLKDGIYSKDGEQPGKPWVKHVPTDVTGRLYLGAIGIIEGIVRTGEQRALIVAGGTITATKPEKVGAVDTIHYTVQVDVPKALRSIDRKAFVSEHWAIVSDVANGESEPKPETITDAQVENLATKFGAAMKGKPATYEYWVDAQRVPHRYAFSFPARVDTNGDMLYSDWGTAKITPPPADQVAPAPPIG